MIPTYRPSESFLRETLAGLLQQDPGPDRMQIEVVDDCSPNMDVEALIARLAGPRVQFRRTERNLGLAGCWNSCVTHARGEWVHLLHQDDLIYPGFYTELASLAASAPDARAVFTRHVLTDAAGHWQMISPLEQATPGLLLNWAVRLAAWQHLQCVAIAVRRDCYEELGGFRADLSYVLDWEMWNRIARRHAFAYSPRILAAYRLHDASETSRLREGLQTLPDYLAGHELILAGVDPAQRAAVRAEFSDRFTEILWANASEMLRQRRAGEARSLTATYWPLISPARRAEFRFLRLRCRVQQLRSRFVGR